MKVYFTNDGFDMKAYDVLESSKADEAVFSIIRDFFSTNKDINAEECIEAMKADIDTSSLALKYVCDLFNEVSEVDYGFIYSLYPEDYNGSGYYRHIKEIDDDLKIRISVYSNIFLNISFLIIFSKIKPLYNQTFKFIFLQYLTISKHCFGCNNGWPPDKVIPLYLSL